LKRAQAAVAVTAIAVALACVALIVQAGRRIYRSIGPSNAVAAADGSLYVLSHGKLHIFAADGRRRAAIALESLGLTRTPSDLAVHDDGRIVVADPDSATLHRCRLPSGPCDTLDLHLHRVNLQQLVPLNSVKLAIDERARRYYVSDNGGHQVVIADFDGRVLDRSKTGLFWFPNHLWTNGAGELHVVDTNHHRIVTLGVAGDRFGPVLREMAAGANALTRPGRTWPFDAAKLPDGRMVVLIADDGMKDADAVLYANGVPQQRIRLGEDSDPFDVEVWRERIVVADATHYRLQAVGLDGALKDDFPPAEFTAELDREREVPAYWRLVRTAAQAGIVLVPLLAILALWKLGVPLASKPAPWSGKDSTSTAPGRKRLELPYSPAYLQWHEKFVFRLSLVAAFAVLAMALMLWLVYASVTMTYSGLQHFGPVFALIVLIAGIQVAALREARRRLRDFRLESSPEGLRPRGSARLGERQIAPWHEVYWDGSRLLVGKSIVPVRHPMAGEMFEREAFERGVLARIPGCNIVSRQRLAARALRAGGWEAIAAVVIIAAMILLYTAIRFRLL